MQVNLLPPSVLLPVLFVLKDATVNKVHLSAPSARLGTTLVTQVKKHASNVTLVRIVHIKVLFYAPPVL